MTIPQKYQTLCSQHIAFGSTVRYNSNYMYWLSFRKQRGETDMWEKSTDDLNQELMAQPNLDQYLTENGA